MKKGLQSGIVSQIEKLEVEAEKVRRSQGFSPVSAKIKMLSELLKEQVRRENSRHTAR